MRNFLLFFLLPLLFSGFTFLYRQNPPARFSGRQLGDAAHRLVANSLQMKVTDRNNFGNQMHAPPRSYASFSFGPPAPSYQNNRYRNDKGNHRGNMRNRTDYHHSNPAIPRDHFDDGFGQPYVSSGAYNSQVGSHSQYERDPPRYGSYQQNGGPSYPPGHVSQYPAPIVAPIPPEGLYNGYGTHQSYGTNNYHHGGAWNPRPNLSGPRGYVHPQQMGNRHAVLDRRGSRRPPPPPGYGRY